MVTTRKIPQALIELSSAAAAKIEILATDIDGTITADGALAPALLEALARLVACGVEPILVSGRPAGEVLGLCRYLPGIRRAVAENGLAAVDPQRGAWSLFSDQRAQRAELFSRVDDVSADVGLRLHPANDAFARVADLAFDRENIADTTLERFAAAAQRQNLYCIWSSVHVHFSWNPPDKGRGLLELVGGERGRFVATIGDARNDFGLFRHGLFGASVGTAALSEQIRGLPDDCIPDFLSENFELDAFLELVAIITNARETTGS
jgi:hydroxymethylpyrimidine pyrophosphatase-like HAD family hydrolase